MEPVPPLYPHAALGFRIWTLEADRLTALAGTFPWHGGANHAECINSHAPADPKCFCGFWACHDLQAVLGFFELGAFCLDDAPRESCVVGAIAARGQIAVHYGGFRCPEARPIGLLLTPGQQRRLGPALRSHYPVPLFTEPAALEEHARRLAVAVPEVERPKLPLTPDQRVEIEELFAAGVEPDYEARRFLAARVGVSPFELPEIAAYMGLGEIAQR